MTSVPGGTDSGGPDAVQTARDIRSARVSSVDVVTACLERISSTEPALNAFTVVLADTALAAARDADARISAGGDLPPLLGVPVSVKDHIWMTGAPATNGSAAYRDFVPAEDCVAVARLRAAGAVIVGKTNNPEFCYRGFTDNDVFGLTRNPWQLDRTPGGSSGGAGASVAAGGPAIALGTDGGGSIRIPASFCGIFGHKPTFGLVPKEPGFRGWKTLSVDGPLTRTVRDAALALSVVAGPAAADDMSYPGPAQDFLAATAERDLSGLRVAYSADLGFAAVDADVRAAFRVAVERFAELGCWPVEGHPPTGNPNDLWNRIALAEGYASEGALLAQWESQMTPGTADIIRAGLDVTAADYLEAVHERAAFTRCWSEFYEEFDLLLTPCMQLTAFEVGLLTPASIEGRPVDPFFDDWCTLVLPANLTGQPAASVPMGFAADGLPVGLQIMGRRFDDATVLAAASAYERLAPWADRWPPVT